MSNSDEFDVLMEFKNDDLVIINVDDLDWDDD